MQKLFLLRSCSDSFFANRSRPCLLYQIRRCSAPCVGRIGTEDYAELVADAKNFLTGKSTGVQARLGKAMAEAAEKRDYELAAVYREVGRCFPPAFRLATFRFMWLGYFGVLRCCPRSTWN